MPLLAHCSASYLLSSCRAELWPGTAQLIFLIWLNHLLPPATSVRCEICRLWWWWWWWWWWMENLIFLFNKLPSVFPLSVFRNPPPSQLTWAAISRSQMGVGAQKKHCKLPNKDWGLFQALLTYPVSHHRGENSPGGQRAIQAMTEYFIAHWRTGELYGTDFA